MILWCLVIAFWSFRLHAGGNWVLVLPIAGKSARTDVKVLEQLLAQIVRHETCQTGTGRPILLVIDDLQTELSTASKDGRRTIRAVEGPILRTLLRAFDPQRCDSRLLITSRFPFVLRDDEELSEILYPIQLRALNMAARQKLVVHQVAAARDRRPPSETLEETALASRVPLAYAAEKLAGGNPGLQDLLGEQLALRRSVPPQQVEAVFSQMAAYLAGGDLPQDPIVRGFLSRLDIDSSLNIASVLNHS